MGSPFEASYDSSELYAVLDDNRSRSVKRRNRPGFGQRVKGMNDRVYRNERRPVMDCIYTAKRWLREVGYELPRIRVRITETDRHNPVMGSAILNANEIYIVDTSIDYTRHSSKDNRLMHVVCHEIVHAVLGKGHDEACPLMASTLPPIEWTRDTIRKNFLKYFK